MVEKSSWCEGTLSSLMIYILTEETVSKASVVSGT